jgi:hypothetical protein
MEPGRAGGVWRPVLRLLIFVGILALAYAAYRRHRRRVLARQADLERKRRRRAQQEAWDRMLEDRARERSANAEDATKPVSSRPAISSRSADPLGSRASGS